MNILIRGNGNESGGVLTWTLSLSKILSKKGFYITYVYEINGKLARKTNQYGEHLILPNKIKSLQKIKFFGLKIYDPQIILKNLINKRRNSIVIENILEEKKIDIILCLSTIYSSEFKLSNKIIKLITCIHTYPAVDNNILRLKDRYLKHTLNNNDKIICVSNFLMERVRKFYDGKIDVVHNSSIDIYTPIIDRKVTKKSYGIPDDCMCIGTLGRFTPKKGFHIVLQAFIENGNIFPNIHCILAGNTVTVEDEEYRQKIIKIANDSDFSDRIHILKETVNTKFFSLIDIFLLGSYGSVETFGLVIIEAMSAGVPVIAPNQGGPAEIIQNYKNGILVEPGNVTEYAKALNLLITDHKKYDQISKESRKTYLSDYNIDAWNNQIIKSIQG